MRVRRIAIQVFDYLRIALGDAIAALLASSLPHGWLRSLLADDRKPPATTEPVRSMKDHEEPAADPARQARVPPRVVVP